MQLELWEPRGLQEPLEPLVPQEPWVLPESPVLREPLELPVLLEL